MQTHNLTQGSPEWLAHRSRCWNASDAPAMLGCSPYETRQQLLHRLFTGITPDVDAATQRRFDEGHRIEALARPLAEEMIGDDLAPVVGSTDSPMYLEGGRPLAASFDGITFMGDQVFEHKTLNEELRNSPRYEIDGTLDPTALPKQYRVQMEQQLIVSGASRVLFMATRWEGDDCVEQLRCFYMGDDALRAEILAGWRQFASDFNTYVPTAAAEPAPVGRAPEALPALRIELTGAVTASNLAEFKDVALGAIRSVNRELSTDRDFADADKAVKWCGDVEDRIKAAKEYALSQTTSIEALFRTLDEVSSEARQVRLDLEKLVKRRKEDRKGELVAATMAAYRTHLEGLAQRFEGRARMPAMPVDFGTVIRGLKSFDSMAEKLDTALANAKIESHKVADQIDASLRALEELAPEHKHLFADLATLVLKPSDDFRAQVQARVSAHKEKVRLEAEAAAEKERARVRAEEEARAAAKVRQEQEAAAPQRERNEAEAREQARQAEIAEAVLKARQDPAVAARHEAMRDAFEIGTGITQTTVAQDGTPEVKHIPAGNVLPMPTKAPPADDSARMNLSDIKDRLHPIQITAEGLASLGFPHVATEKASKLYRAADFGRICDSLVAHIRMAQEQQRAA